MAERVLNIDAPRGSMWKKTFMKLTIENWPIVEDTINFGDFTGPNNGFTSTSLVGTAKTPASTQVTFMLRERMFPNEAFETLYLDVKDGVTFDYEDVTSMSDLLSVIQALSVKVDGVKLSTDKLTGIETKVNAIDTLTKHSTNGLASIKSEVAAVKTLTSGIDALTKHSTNGLAAIKSEITATKTAATEIKSVIDAVNTLINHASNGLPAIKTVINNVKADTTSIITKVDGVSASQPDNSEIRELLRVANNRIGVLRYILNGTQFPG